MRTVLSTIVLAGILLANVVRADLEVGSYAPDVEAEEWLNAEDTLPVEKIPSLKELRGMVVVLFFWVFGKLGGWLINALVVRHFGSGATSDAYYFAAQGVVYGLILSPAVNILLPAFIPVFTEERLRGGEKAAWAFARSVCVVVLLGCAVLADEFANS